MAPTLPHRIIPVVILAGMYSVFVQAAIVADRLYYGPLLFLSGCPPTRAASAARQSRIGRQGTDRHSRHSRQTDNN